MNPVGTSITKKCKKQKHKIIKCPFPSNGITMQDQNKTGKPATKINKSNQNGAEPPKAEKQPSRSR